MLTVKNPLDNAGGARDTDSIPGSGGSLEEEMATHSVFLPGESHGQRRLVGYGPRGRKESDTTGLRYTHITLRKLGRKAKCIHVEQWNN